MTFLVFVFPLPGAIATVQSCPRCPRVNPGKPTQKSAYGYPAAALRNGREGGRNKTERWRVWWPVSGGFAKMTEKPHRPNYQCRSKNTQRGQKSRRRKMWDAPGVALDKLVPNHALKQDQ